MTDAGRRPERTCIGCRRRRRIAALVRVTSAEDGSLAVGRTLAGRGAWLCVRSPDCLNSAIQRHAFSRALRVEVPQTAVEALRDHLTQTSCED